MWRPGWGCSGNPHQRPCLRRCRRRGRQGFRPVGDVPLFEKMLRINMLSDILAVESGYEEGCEWGARFQSANSGGSWLTRDPVGMSPSGFLLFSLIDWGHGWRASNLFTPTVTNCKLCQLDEVQ